MKATVLATILLSLITSSNAQPVFQAFNDDDMKTCIEALVDDVGAINADNVNIVKTCLCVKAEVNKTTTRQDFVNAFTTGNTAFLLNKVIAARKKCDVLKITKAPTPSSKSETPDTSRTGLPFWSLDMKQKFVNTCVSSSMKHSKGNFRLEIQQMCNCAADEAQRTVTELDVTRSIQGDNSGLNDKRDAALLICKDRLRIGSNTTKKPSSGPDYSDVPLLKNWGGPVMHPTPGITKASDDGGGWKSEAQMAEIRNEGLWGAFKRKFKDALEK